MKIDTLCVGEFMANCYIVSLQCGKCFLIDPGAEADRIKSWLKKNKLTPSFILHTHGHIDHIGADKDFSLDIYIHKNDIFLLKDADLNLSRFLAEPFTIESDIKPLEDKQKIFWEGVAIETIHTPGHTAGSSCFFIRNHNQKVLFSGDTLFCNSVGRTDFPGSSYKDLINSIKEKIFVLDDDTYIYPGHGPTSLLGKEKKDNPFLNT